MQVQCASISEIKTLCNSNPIYSISHLNERLPIPVRSVQLLDNSQIRQLADCKLADWTSRGLVNSWTRQLTDWTSRGLDNSRIPTVDIK